MENKMFVYEKAIDARVIGIMRKFDVSKGPLIARALQKGGVSIMEITMDTPNALEAISQIRLELGHEVAIGAGTVLDSETARSAVLAGAQFLVSPNLNVSVIATGNRYGVPVIPGCMTPTEIVQACEAGADIVKIFPAISVGGEFFRTVKGPLQHVSLMATGGVSIENAREFRNNGADFLGVGGKLVNKQLVAENRFEEMSDYARKLVELARLSA